MYTRGSSGIASWVYPPLRDLRVNIATLGPTMNGESGPSLKSWLQGLGRPAPEGK